MTCFFDGPLCGLRRHLLAEGPFWAVVLVRRGCIGSRMRGISRTLQSRRPVASAPLPVAKTP